MKRVGGLHDRVLERDNFLVAFHRAARGKRHRLEVREFQRDLPYWLPSIAPRLCTDKFQFGRFHQFVIRDPKERIITAPCFEERVVHHAIMNVCEPVLDRWLIDDTFACRVGRGRLAAEIGRTCDVSSRHVSNLFFIHWDLSLNRPRCVVLNRVLAFLDVGYFQLMSSLIGVASIDGRREFDFWNEPIGLGC